MQSISVRMYLSHVADEKIEGGFNVPQVSHLAFGKPRFDPLDSSLVLLAIW